MTQEEKATVEQMRRDGKSYGAIAKTLNLSLSSVKAYCQRSGFSGKSRGKPIIQKEHIKRRIFCSKSCREQWWAKHADCMKKKAVYEFTCAKCGAAFTAYGNKHRKYCSHKCYIAARFGGVANE